MPGFLRGSGAACFFGHTEDLTRTAWRGGWARHRTMEAYLQESALHAVLRAVDVEHRRLLADLAELAPRAMYSTLAGKR